VTRPKPTAPQNWREAIDIDALISWMDQQGLGSGPIQGPQELSGGTQNILLRFDRGNRSFVLRRPPNHPYRDGSKTIDREARMLAALADTDVPHAKLIAACDDHGVLGASFYLMEPINGFNANGDLPSPHADDPAIRQQMGYAMVDALLALGRVDFVANGVQDMGNYENFLERQVPRWWSQLESYSKYEGWPGVNSLQGIKQVSHWLEDNLPQTFTPGIMHGDYHLSNVMFSHNGPELVAIVDWELTTIGDPLIDLGWLIATWPDSTEHKPGDIGATPWDGFADRQALVDHYARHTSREMAHITWYGVFACYKMAILLEGTHARACAGKAPVVLGDWLHASATGLISRALVWIR